MTILESPPTAPYAESSIPVLETERLVLRAPRIEDVPAIAELADNAAIAEMTVSLPHPYRADDARAFVETLALGANAATFAIFLKRPRAAGLFAGMASIATRPGEALPELGYWIGEPLWSRGIATEAARAVIDYVFSETDMPSLAGAARVVNPASRRVLEKCGFQWTGVGLTRVRALGASVPVDRFQLDRRTWVSIRAWGSTALPHRRAAAV